MLLNSNNIRNESSLDRLRRYSVCWNKCLINYETPRIFVWCSFKYFIWGSPPPPKKKVVLLPLWCPRHWRVIGFPFGKAALVDLIRLWSYQRDEREENKQRRWTRVCVVYPHQYTNWKFLWLVDRASLAWMMERRCHINGTPAIPKFFTSIKLFGSPARGNDRTEHLSLLPLMTLGKDVFTITRPEPIGMPPLMRLVRKNVKQRDDMYVS